MTELKLDIKKKARLIKGIANLLVNDAEFMCVDTDDFNLINLNRAVPDYKKTIQSLIDNVMELDYLLYLASGSREKSN